jgi:hypothetical protein
MNVMASSALALVLTVPVLGSEVCTNTPDYDLKTETKISGSVTEVIQVPPGSALEGTQLKIRNYLETAVVYLGPPEFIKIFDFKFHAGEEVEITGSKVKCGTNELILARRVSVGNTLIVFRNEKGTPQWLWMKRMPMPTGL